jgi:hypothetical protein
MEAETMNRLKSSRGPIGLIALLLSLSMTMTRSAWAQQNMLTVPAGTRLLIRINDSLDSRRDRAGTIFTGRLETNIQVGNTVLAPRGTPVHGRLIDASSAGRVAGRAGLSLELTDVIIGGTAFPVRTGNFSVQGSSNFGQSAGRTARGAGLGTVIGALSGNAGMGAAIGATAGGAATAFTRGQDINIPSETLLEFILEQPAPLPRG